MNESVPNLLWDSAKRLYFGSPLMKVIFVCELVSSIVATVFAAVMATAILLTQVLHFNIRLLLACTCTAMAVSNVEFYGKASLLHEFAPYCERVRQKLHCCLVSLSFANADENYFFYARCIDEYAPGTRLVRVLAQKAIAESRKFWREKRRTSKKEHVRSKKMKSLNFQEEELIQRQSPCDGKNAALNPKK
ncbi:unnamed protein product [Toxocara canis]|uniref:Uncharacterized protein n=1 Tax=Toxocara canis TaxID=6265 RepID=A0A183VFS9_TOXCA|nr:unnamed protein product [Toxocara canis]